MALPLPELWRHRTPSSLVNGVALLGDDGGVRTLAELLAPGAKAVDGIAEILFPSGLPARPLAFSTMITDSFTHRTYVTVVSHRQGPLATCAWSHLPEVASPTFLNLMRTVHGCLEDPDDETNATAFARIWGWLVHEVPAPPPGTSLILHGLATGAIRAVQRPACGLPAVYVPTSLQLLLTRLSVSDLLLVVRLLLLEQKVLFVSSSVALLTSACEAFSSILLFPLAWVHCYNPLLPSMDYLATPPPFLFGCLRDIFLKESFADSHDLLSSEILSGDRDFSIFDLDTGDVYPDESEIPDLPGLPDAAQSRLRCSITELRSKFEAFQDLWPEGTSSESFEESVQKIFLTFTCDLLGDVPGSLGPSCEVATAASVHESFQEVQFLSNVCSKDKPFFQSFVQTSAFLDYLQTLHLFGSSKSPLAEAVQGLQGTRYILPKPRFDAEISEPQPVPSKTSRAAIALCQQGPPLELHLFFGETAGAALPETGSSEVLVEWNRALPSEPVPELEPFEAHAGAEGLVVAFADEASWRGNARAPPPWAAQLCQGFYQAAGDELHERLPKAMVTDFWTSAVLLYAALGRSLSAPDDFLLRTYLAIVDRPAALPTHCMLSLMGSLEPHHLHRVFDRDLQLETAASEPEPSPTASVSYARRLQASANPVEPVDDALLCTTFVLLLTCISVSIL